MRWRSCGGSTRPSTRWAGSALLTGRASDDSTRRAWPSPLYLPPVAPELAVAGPWAMPWISARLRQPDGCPWDREQTHASLRKHLLEETYEVYDALDEPARRPSSRRSSATSWLQIVLHAQLAAEAGVFDLADVQAAIASKIVRRHPHVFGDAVARPRRTSIGSGSGSRPTNGRPPPPRTSAGEDGAAATPKSALDGISPSMPALAASQEMQERAANLGYDWPTIDGVLDKVVEETDELRRAADDVEWTEEFGDLLFVLVNVARWRGIEAEAAVRAANDKFRRRFGRVERQVAARGVALRDLDFDALDACGMPPRLRRRRHDDRQPTAHRSSRRPRSERPAAGVVHPRRPEMGRGLVPDQGRRHRGPVRGHDRRPRPAAPPRQGHRLGDRRVLDAAAGDRRANRSRDRSRAGSAAGPTRSSA